MPYMFPFIWQSWRPHTMESKMAESYVCVDVFVFAVQPPFSFWFSAVLVERRAKEEDGRWTPWSCFLPPILRCLFVHGSEHVGEVVYVRWYWFRLIFIWWTAIRGKRERCFFFFLNHVWFLAVGHHVDVSILLLYRYSKLAASSSSLSEKESICEAVNVRGSELRSTGLPPQFLIAADDDIRRW